MGPDPKAKRGSDTHGFHGNAGTPAGGAGQPGADFGAGPEADVAAALALTGAKRKGPKEEGTAAEEEEAEVETTATVAVANALPPALEAVVSCRTG